MVYRSIIQVLFVFLFTSYHFGCLQNIEEDVEAITRVSKKRAEAFNNGDAKGIAIHFTEDAVLMPPGQSSLTGRKAVEEYYQSIFDEYQTELQSKYLEVEVSGDLAFGRGYAKVKLTPKNGGMTTYSESEYINILKKQPDGSWKTTHDIWNSNQ